MRLRWSLAAMFAIVFAGCSTNQSAIPNPSSAQGVSDGVSPDSVTAKSLVATYPLGNNSAFYIAEGPDGNVWVSGDQWFDSVTTTGVVTSYTDPSDTIGENRLTAGPGNTVWSPILVTNAALSIASIATSTGQITEYPVTPSEQYPAGIAEGFDQNLYVTGYNTGLIYRVTATGTVTALSPPTAGSGPTAIAKGPDNSVWFIENKARQIAKLTTKGVFTEYALPATGQFQYDQLVKGGGSNLFAITGNTIYEVAKTGAVTKSFTCPALNNPYDAALGPDGQIWIIAGLGQYFFEFRPSTGVCSPTIAPPNPLTPPSSAILSGLAKGANKDMWIVGDVPSTPPASPAYVWVYR